MDVDICDKNEVLSQSICAFMKAAMWKWYFFINDLISLDNQKMYTFNEFVNTYNVNINFVEYYGIIRAIPNYWK
jgi:hypothetical protein